MADDRETPQKKDGKRSRVWSALPRRPRLFKQGPVSAREEANKLSRGLRDVHHTCPHDGAPMQLTQVYPMDELGEIKQGSEPYRALVCPECSFTVPVAALAERLKLEAAPLMKASRHYTIFAFAIVAFAALLSILNGNLLTLLGALILSMTLFVKALFLRYRYWQAHSGHMFEDESPFPKWVKEEWSGKADT